MAALGTLVAAPAPTVAAITPAPSIAGMPLGALTAARAPQVLQVANFRIAGTNPTGSSTVRQWGQLHPRGDANW